MKTLILPYLMLFSVFAFSCDQNNDVPKLEQKPSGTWVSENAEDLGNGTFGYREFTFDENSWNLKFSLFLDEAMNKPVIMFRTFGNYEITGDSKLVSGANEATFFMEKKFLTLLTDNEDVITNFGFSNCNLSMNVEKEITNTGCSFFVSNDVCDKEYDLLQLKDNKLYLGERITDMCQESGRPKGLNYPLIKK